MADWELRILDELAEMGLEHARALERRVQARAAQGLPLTAPGGENVGVAFERIAREVCKTIALSVRLERDMRSRRARPAQQPAPPRAPTPPLPLETPLTLKTSPTLETSGTKRTVH